MLNHYKRDVNNNTIGKSSILEAQFFPAIEFSEKKNYVLGSVELLSFNSIPNIDGKNNF